MPTVIPGSGGPTPWPFEKPKFPLYFTALNGGVRADIVMQLNVVQCSRIVLAEDIYFNRIGVYVVTAAASSTVRVGVYRDSDGNPGAKVYEYILTTTTTGTKENSSVAVLLTAGTYWLAAVAQGGTPTVTTHDPLLGMSANSGAGIANPPVSNSPYRHSITGALPNPFGTVDGRTSHAPLVFLQVGG